MPEKLDSDNSEKQLTVQEAELGPIILLDSSFILALLNLRDSNHKPASSILGFISPYNCRFHIPLYVFAEVISKRIQQEGKVSSALKDIKKFLNQLKGAFIPIPSPNVEDIINRYKKLAKKKIKFLQSNDFLICTEGILLKSIIVTCDYDMYEKVKKYYLDIYYVAAHSSKYKDDIPSFNRRILQLVKKK